MTRRSNSATNETVKAPLLRSTSTSSASSPAAYGLPSKAARITPAIAAWSSGRSGRMITCTVRHHEGGFDEGCEPGLGVSGKRGRPVNPLEERADFADGRIDFGSAT